MLNTHIGTVSRFTLTNNSVCSSHVRIVVIKKQLVILVHGESALINQEDDQTNGEQSEYSSNDLNWRHKPPRQIPNPSAAAFHFMVGGMQNPSTQFRGRP